MRLDWLRLNHTPVTDACLKGLAGCNQLRRLDLEKTTVTDAGLKELATFKQLRALNLSETRVTNAGLKQLAALKQLRDLYVGSWGGETSVTKAGVDELMKAQPNLYVLFSDPDFRW